MLGRYRLLGLLGQGGFGRTYRAEDTQGGPPRDCVVKLGRVQPGPGGKPQYDAAAALQREITLLRTLGTHPQIPALLDWGQLDWGQDDRGQDDRGWVVVQQYVPAPSLAQLPPEPWPEARLRSLLLALLPLLTFIHRHGVIHRDIKPANILLPPAPAPPVLVDFGAAKVYRLAAETGTVIGSAGYIAPEQALGQAVFASDLYSLGLTCLYLATGLHPFDLYSAAADGLLWRPALPQPLSPGLGRVLDGLTQRSLARRYATAAAALADLGWGAEMAAIPKDGSKKDASKKGTFPTDTALSKPIPPSPPWPLVTTLVHDWGRVNALAFSPSSLALATATSDGTITLWDCAQGTQIVQFSRTLGLPTLGWRTLGLRGQGHRGEATAVTFTPDGHYLLSGGQDSCLWQWDLDQYRGQVGATLGGWLTTGLHLTADGRTLAVGLESGEIQLWQGPPWTLAHRLVRHQQRVNALALAATTAGLSTVLSVSQDSTLRAWDITTGRLLQTQPVGQPLQAVALHGPSQIGFGGGAGGQLYRWLPTQAVGEPLHRYRGAVTAMAVGGPWLAVGLDSGDVALWNMLLGDMAPLRGQTPLSHGWAVRALAFSPDGRWLASGGADGRVRLWAVPPLPSAKLGGSD